MASAGFSGIQIGLNCTECGGPITVDYMGHGDDLAALTSEAMKEFVVAAVRGVISRDGAQKCATCQACQTISVTAFQGRS